MEFDAEQLQKQIPYYLTAEDQKVLLRELKSFADSGAANFLLSDSRDTFKQIMLQGDGWRGFEVFVFDTGERRTVRGLVLSNSCDVDPENQRDWPARVMFAPIVRLSVYEDLLKKSGIDAKKIEAKLASIRAQKTSNMFFLAASDKLPEDCVVRLDDAHTMPVEAHLKREAREKLFTLNNTGFYMLVFKLSYHFCRLQERVNRKDVEQAA